MTFSNSYVLFDDQEIADLQDFWFAKYGTTFSFCLPSWQTDLTTSAAAEAGDTVIGVNAYAATLRAGMNLFFYAGDTYFARPIASYTSSAITLSSPIPVGLPNEFGVSIIYRVTFAEDALAIEQETNSIAHVNLKFTEEIRNPDDVGETL